MGVITVLCFLSLILASINSLPIAKTVESLPKIETPETVAENENVTVKSASKAVSLARNTIRPGMVVRSYHVQLEPDVNSGRFNGEVLIVVDITQATREDDIVFHMEDLEVSAVRIALMMSNTFNDASYDDDDGLLTIELENPGTMFTIQVEYSGSMDTLEGLYAGSYGDGGSYVAMNLHPTNARRVFPCIDEPSEASTITFTVHGLDYTHVVANSMLDDVGDTQFRPMGGPAHLWGILAHNFVNINNPVVNVPLFVRPGVTSQDSQIAVAINAVFNRLNVWTEKDYFNIVEGVQDGRMNIIALPDVSYDWHSLSIVGVWEPYILMEIQHGVKQRKEAFVNVAEAISRQWFGYVTFPENWIYEWVITGLRSYAAYDALKFFQSNDNFDDTLLDMNTIFVTDVIQESMLLDSFADSWILEPGEMIFDEESIRQSVSGLVKYKAPAILSMLRICLGGEDEDFIHDAIKNLLISKALQPVNSLDLIGAINSQWMGNNNGLVDDVEEYLQPYIETNGYALLNVDLSPRGVILTQERFGFSSRASESYEIPITYTTSINPNFDDVYPSIMLGAALFSLDVTLDEEDWILFNIQGQGYYRVNYGLDLWERIIETLEDPEERLNIHPLNRATLIDDALNLARAGRLNYDIAFRVVLTMEHETEYAVWKAFIRNMEFLKKRLVAAVLDDEDLDQDIYLRMVRRSIIAFENEVGFSPETNINEPAMTSLARGIVMEHACKSNYNPCIAAAVDWFYDPNSNDPAVNPDIPHDLRPAVYCTMVRTGDNDVMDALQARLEIVPNMYERIVILEAMACSEDAVFINSYLAETIASNSPYSMEERSRIFKAIADSSYDNADRALRFLVQQTNAIRSSYGGKQRLEEIIFSMVNNLADAELTDVFARWVTSTNSNLEDSVEAAERASAMADENLLWNNNLFEEAYEWIFENDANAATISLFLVCLTFALTLFNH